VEKCVAAAVGVQSPVSAAWRLLARFCTLTDDTRRAKTAALESLRLLQASGWQHDAQCVGAVADCLQGLIGYGAGGKR